MTQTDSLTDAFAGLVPELERMAAARFRHLDAEAQAEAVQNTLALTWKAYVALIERGRGAEPGIVKSILWYSCKQTRRGRMAQGAGRSKDVLEYGRRGRVQIEWVDLRDLVNDSTPVPEQVSFRLDVPMFLATLNPRQQQLAKDLASGMTTTEAAAQHRVTLGAVSQFRARFKRLFNEFMNQ